MLHRLFLSFCCVLVVSTIATAKPISPFYVEWKITDTCPARPDVNVEAAVATTRKQLRDQHAPEENVSSLVNMTRKQALLNRSGWEQTTIMDWRTDGTTVQSDSWSGQTVPLGTSALSASKLAGQHRSAYEYGDLGLTIDDISGSHRTGHIERLSEPEVREGCDSLPIRCLLLGGSTERLLHSKRATIRQTTDQMTLTLDRTYRDPKGNTWLRSPLRIALSADGKQIVTIDTVQRFSGVLEERVRPSHYETVNGISLPRTIEATFYLDGKITERKVYKCIAFHPATTTDIVQMKPSIQHSMEFIDTRFGEPGVWYPAANRIPTEAETWAKYSAARRGRIMNVFWPSALLFFLTAGILVGILHTMRRG